MKPWIGAYGVVMVGALTLAMSCGGGDDGGPSDEGPHTPKNHAVTVNDGFFYPEEITIASGDSVTWTWSDNDDHSVTEGTWPDPSQEPDAFDSGIRSNGNFGHRFPQVGTFFYFCREHGDMDMSGQVTVQQP